MGSKTKILVINSKQLIIYSAIALIAIIIILSVIIHKHSDKTPRETTPQSNYTPGVYSSTITIGNSPIDIEVCVDADRILSISFSNSNEYIETMYPMLNSSLDYLSEQICANNTTENINIDTASQYTCMLLLNAINEALIEASAL